MTKKVIGVLLLLAAAIAVGFVIRIIYVYAAYTPQKGDLVKAPLATAIYYIDEDGMKHLFPTEPIFWTWFGGGWRNQKIIKISPSELEELPTGDNIMSRPGTNLIKFDDDSRTFAVTTGGALCQVLENYGYKWPDRIIIIQAAFKKDYLNQPDCVINNTSRLPDTTIIQYTGSEELYYLQNGKKRLITDRGFEANGFKYSSILKDVDPRMAYENGPVLDQREAAISDLYVKKTGPCVENWFCEDWSACKKEGMQTRACQELNKCGTEIQRPTTTQSCVYVEIKPCANVNCPDICNGPNAKSGGYCQNGDCVYPKTEINNFQCLAKGSFTCSQLSGEICAADEICSAKYHYDVAAAKNYFQALASDSARCCDKTNQQVAGCIRGDITITGPAKITETADGWKLEIANFIVDYRLKTDGSLWKINNIDADLYIDGRLIKSGTIWAQPQDNPQMTLAEFASGNYTAIYYLSSQPRSIKLILDPNDKLTETNEDNNSIEIE